MWRLEGFQNFKPVATLIAGPKTIQDSGWSPFDLESKSCLVQGGDLPGTKNRTILVNPSSLGLSKHLK